MTEAIGVMVSGGYVKDLIVGEVPGSSPRASPFGFFCCNVYIYLKWFVSSDLVVVILFC
jgi:hypothetical protein